MFLSADLVARLDAIAIVLVSPQGALNLGSIARVMKNMGLSRLTLVNPQCDPYGEEARRMAVHAFDILERARVVQTIPEAIANITRTIATTARSRSVEAPLQPPEHGLPWLLDAPSALLFGPEDRGLSNDELAYAQRFVCIPTSEAYPSLNLAQAVAVCARDLVRSAQNVAPAFPRSASTPATQRPSEPAPEATPEQATSEGEISEQAIPEQATTQKSNVGDLNLLNASHKPSGVAPSGMPGTGETPDNEATLGQLEGYYQHLEHVLLDIGYLHSHTATARMEKFRRLFNRSQLSEQEVAMLRGILRQVEWASRRSPTTIDDAN